MLEENVEEETKLVNKLQVQFADIPNTDANGKREKMFTKNNVVESKEHVLEKENVQAGKNHHVDLLDSKSNVDHITYVDGEELEETKEEKFVVNTLLHAMA